MDKKAIAAILDEMGTLLELQGANPFKSRAFHNASRTVEGVAQDLSALVASGELTGIKGIGKSIAGIITELVLKGKSVDYDDLRREFPDGVLDMLRIQGLGPKKVKVLHETLKISSLAELEEAAKADRLSALEGFGRKTQDNILKGLEAQRSRADKNLYPNAAGPAHAVYDRMMKQRGVIRGEIAGSLRRRKEIIGDIDIVISARDEYRQDLMEAFVTAPGVKTIVARGETKSTVLLEGGISCDLRVVNDREFPFALNYFTGSKEHNVEMRTRARRYGWSLNEYGFSRLGEEEKRGKAKQFVRCNDEAEIYRALDLAYIAPELRESMGEIDAAENNILPSLVEEKDIRGTFHCHSTYSDGVNSIEQMARAAHTLGWEYLGIADHSKAAAYAGGLTADRVKEQFREIDRLNETMKRFRIFKGTECDILQGGELDWPERILAAFEYVVVSIHSGFKMTGPDMTRRIVKALKNKHVTMLGHPTGRLLLSREPYAVDMVEVINAASDYGKMIEINAHPMRLDLDWRWCKYAREKGVLIPINPDAHNTEGLRDVSYGVGVARKGWLERKNVLNTRPVREVSALFQQ